MVARRSAARRHQLAPRAWLRQAPGRSCRRGAQRRSSAERERSEDRTIVLVGAVSHVFRRRAFERSAASVLDDCAAAHTAPRPENPPPSGPARTEGRTALRAHPSRPPRRASASPAARGRRAARRRRSAARPTRPSTDPPLAVTAGRIPSRSVSAFRSGCTAVRSGSARRGGFSGRGMCPLKRHRPRRLLRCAHEPAAGKHGTRSDEDGELSSLHSRWPDVRAAPAVDNALFARSRR